MGKRMSTPRFNVRKMNKKIKLVNHPKHGLMIYRNGWVTQIDESELDIEDCEEYTEYSDNMRVKGELTNNPGSHKEKKECESCGKNTTISMLVNNVCQKCAVRLRDLDDELRDLRYKFKFGDHSYIGNMWENLDV